MAAVGTQTARVRSAAVGRGMGGGVAEEAEALAIAQLPFAASPGRNARGWIGGGRSNACEVQQSVTSTAQGARLDCRAVLTARHPWHGGESTLLNVMGDILSAQLQTPEIHASADVLLRMQVYGRWASRCNYLMHACVYCNVALLIQLAAGWACTHTVTRAGVQAILCGPSRGVPEVHRLGAQAVRV